MDTIIEQVHEKASITPKDVNWQIDADTATKVKGQVSKAGIFLNRSGVP